MRSSKDHKFDQEFFKQYAYLYLVDVDGLAAGRLYPDYEIKEPGYTYAFLKAMNFAFAEKMDRRINENFIKNLQKHAISHLPKEKPGDYKTNTNTIPLGFTENSYNPNATLEGFWQFANTWIIKAKEPIHFIHLKSDDGEMWLTPINALGNQGIWLQIRLGNEVHIYPYDEECKEIIDQALQSLSYQCYINSTPAEILPRLGYRQPIETIVSQRMRGLCESYNNEILAAKTDDEKLEVIIKHVQWIDQLHPFIDGNIRTSYILLNRLLYEEGLQLTLLINPNRFDCFSLEQLKKMVKEGQDYVEDLLNNRVPQFKDEYMKVNPEITPVDLTNAEEELMEMVRLFSKLPKRVGGVGYDPKMFAKSVVLVDSQAKLDVSNRF